MHVSTRYTATLLRLTHAQLIQCIIFGWPVSKNKITQEIRPHWTFKDDLVVTDCKMIKSKCIIIPEELQKQSLDQLDSNHMGIKNEATSL